MAQRIRVRKRTLKNRDKAKGAAVKSTVRVVPSLTTRSKPKKKGVARRKKA
jgi:hypothetical protein